MVPPYYWDGKKTVQNLKSFIIHLLYLTQSPKFTTRIYLLDAFYIDIYSPKERFHHFDKEDCKTSNRIDAKVMCHFIENL